MSRLRSGARVIGMQRRSMAGQIEAKGATIDYESSLERDFVLLADWDHDVCAIVAQPLRLDFMDRTGRKRRYTPDFLVTRRDGARSLHEVKYWNDLKDNWLEFKPKFQHAIEWCEQRQMTFHIETDRRIRTTQLANIRLLRPYRSRDNEAPTIRKSLLDAAKQAKSTTIGALIETLGITESPAVVVTSLWSLIATESLTADLSKPLGPTSIISCNGVET